LRYGITGAVAHPQVDYDAYGSKPWAKEPGQSINYVSCHDNYTLWDKLSVSCPEASEEKKKSHEPVVRSHCIYFPGCAFYPGR